MQYLKIYVNVVIIALGLTLSGGHALAGWVANADYSSCPSSYRSGDRSEGPFGSESACLARVREVEASQRMSCVRFSCRDQGGSSGSSASPQAGHEMDQHIGTAISAGISGDISATDTVGLVGMGLIGNALLSPGTPQRPKTYAEIEAERVAAERAAIEAARRERERQARKDERADSMFALLDPIPEVPADEPPKSNFYTKGFDHASQCISQNAGTSCSGMSASEQQICIDGYRAGYDAGDKQRIMAMEQAFQAGLTAGARGERQNGGADARAVGQCRQEWIQSYDRGHYQGKNRKTVK